jgi:hypothetical protein
MAAPSQLESRARAARRRTDRRGRPRPGACGRRARGALLLPLAAVVPAASKTVKEAPTAGSLDARWEQALHEDEPTWFAYALKSDRIHEDETLVSDSDGGNADDLKPGDVTLADRFSCGPDDAVILFHVAHGHFDRVAIRSAKLAPPKGGMIAVGVIPVEESFTFLAARLAETPDDDKRAAVIVSAMSLHPSERVVPSCRAADGNRGRAPRQAAGCRATRRKPRSMRWSRMRRRTTRSASAARRLRRSATSRCPRRRSP